MHYKKINNRTAQRLLLSSVTSLSILTLGAAGKAAIIPGLYNTGELTTAPTLVADGSADPHYTLVGGNNTALVTNQTSWQISGGGWAADTTSSKWISPQSYYGNSSVTGGVDAVGNYTYTTTFSLAGLNPATATISGTFYADDGVVQIDLNGGNTGVALQGPGHSNSLVSQSFSISSGFVAGTNTLSFVVDNTARTGSNPSGLMVENFTGTAATAVPEPAALGLMSLAVVGLASRRKSSK